jgi:hypothetical protein
MTASGIVSRFAEMKAIRIVASLEPSRERSAETVS